MKLHKKLFAALTIGLIASAPAKIDWLTDLQEAKKAAAKEEKMLLVNFTGSDWCTWCIRLDEEVFEKEAFEKTAAQYVSVKLDFPEDDSLTTPEQRTANEALGEKYAVQGFPSIVLMTAKGKPIARTGYQAGGPEAYAEHLAEISKPWNELKSAKGEARAEALHAFLKEVAGTDIETFFQKEFAELKKLDPEDKTGFLTEFEASKRMAAFEDSIENDLAAGDFDAVIKTVDDYLAKNDPQGEKRQHVTMAKVMVLVEQGEKEKAFAQLDEMAQMAPDSEIAQNLEDIKGSISSHLELREKMEEEAANPPSEEGEEAETPESDTIEKAEPAEKSE